MLRTVSFRIVNAWDRYYRRHHRLEPVGPVFFVGTGPYTGSERRFPDGTLLARGDRVGTLHFNNALIAGLDRERASRHLTAWQFARLLRESLEALAAYSVSRGDARSVVAYQGTTWMQTHGLKVGFTIEPLPQGWRTRLLRIHFRVLKACFAPAAFRHTARALEPRNFWITRTQLQKHFGRADA